MAVVAARPLSASTYASHALHAHERSWPETNCYVDLWIELLNGLGYEPLASLPYVFTTDFEGDHFTFFKPPPEDLRKLYGLVVQEQPMWRHLLEHLKEQLGQGRLILVELDSFYLPDTRGTAYQQEHVKTTVGACVLDVEGKRLGYFHNRGFYELNGDDFDGAFRLLPKLRADADILPPYLELVKTDGTTPKRGPELVAASLEVLRSTLKVRPQENPIARFRPRLEKDVAWLLTEPMTSYHLYVFNTFRQLGASFELGKSYLEWLEANGQTGLGVAAKACGVISETSKALLMVLARAVSRKKPPDLKASMDALETAWADVFRVLDTHAWS